MNSEESDPPSNGNYRLEVKDFGPIVNANVEFRPLTVFVGPSNTGKSYLAILAYALHRCFGDAELPPYRQRRGYAFWPSMMDSKKRNRSTFASLASWIAALPDTKTTPVLPGDVAGRVRTLLEEVKEFDQYLEAEMLRCFGVDHHDELVRRPGNQDRARIALSIPQELGRESVQYEFDFGQGTTHLSGRIKTNEQISRVVGHLEDLYEMVPPWARTLDQAGSDDRESAYLFGWFVDQVFRALIRPLTADAFYLPADRTGVMHSHQVVVSALIQRAATAGLRPSTEVPMLSGVLADFLDDLISIDTPPSRMYRPRPARDLARNLERQVLEGAVRRDHGETGYPIFSYRPRGWKNDLPLMRTSSMVSELAPVVLYLRHIVHPGHLLIIEEPESHLHPAMQAVFAVELVRLVHAGVRIILTTHSEWFVEQIGNLVRLSSLPEARRTGIPGADVALTPDQVGVWLFKPKGRPKGSVVAEATLDPDTGLFPTGYDDVSEALYNDSAETFNRLQEGLDE